MKCLNVFLRIQRFQTESARSVSKSLQQGDLLVLMDIKDTFSFSPCTSDFYVVRDCHFQMMALPSSFFVAPRVFTKALASVLALFRSWGVHMWDSSIQALNARIQQAVQTLQNFGWSLSLQGSALALTRLLE